ncbi:MAG: metalloregulator ArsR/SmtB family transcription factor [Pseudomonadales bacterium]|nr:metalloregulator ArsR/SmtB family transcription factor [Pseudomonadales bacterium]
MKPAVAEFQSEHLAELVKITKAAGDSLRAQILHALADDAFGVLELCDLFGMAQPAMSHHLKVLHEAGLVTRRKEGTTVFYQRVVHTAHALVTTIYDELDREPASRDLEKKLTTIHHQRNQRSQDFFANNADALSQQRELICAPEVYHDTVMEIVSYAHPLRRTRALEVGPGNGLLLKSLAHQFTDVIGIDSSTEVLARTAKEVEDASVKLIEQDFLRIPKTKRYDLILAAMVVHHFPSPAKFFKQARALLRKQGLIVLAELCAHEHDWVQAACGDLWQGFTEEQIHAWAHRAGLQIQDQQFLAQRNGFRVQVVSMAIQP